MRKLKPVKQDALMEQSLKYYIMNLLNNVSPDPDECLKLKQTMAIGGLVAERLNGEVSLRPARAYLITFPGDIAEFWKSQAHRKSDQRSLR